MDVIVILLYARGLLAWREVRTHLLFKWMINATVGGEVAEVYNIARCECIVPF